MHNLFGNTNTVHVSLAAGGGCQIEHVVTGDTVTDVLKYVSYSREAGRPFAASPSWPSAPTG